MQKISSNFHFLRNKGFFDLLSVNFLTQFLGFGSTLLVAKFVTPVELGDIKILQSYTALFVILAGFGFNAAVLKVCAEDRPDQEKLGILRLAVQRAGVATAITILLVIVLALSGVITSTLRLSLWLIVYACTIPLQVLTGIFIVFLQAQKKIKEMARSQAVVKIQSVVLIVISTWAWGFKGFIFATIAAYALGLWPFLRQIGVNFLHTPLEQKPARFMQYAFFSVLGNGIALLGQRGDILILDHFTVDRAAIGYYALATIFVTAASQVTGTVQSITTPYFSEHAQDETWFRRQLFLNQLRMALLGVAVAVGVYVLAWILVPLVYGPDYSPTLSFLAILLINYVIASSTSLVGVAIFSLGFVKYNSLSVMISTPISLITTFVFLTKFGIIGVAWAQVVLALVSLCINAIFVNIVLNKAFK
ncbi:oligosaccharide flippase family protein [Candidatus Villigracilis saccharophilus]|uniref:lipopolysaccharide biosynthesis protein n=1 Tax=Candidatus Villigracilis saccharophilus TaxID=3140684 RepID=UPI003134D2EE|nr:oligosaccharide flippase family protein [Anaerolineales bacterium]